MKMLPYGSQEKISMAMPSGSVGYLYRLVHLCASKLLHVWIYTHLLSRFKTNK